MDEQSIEIVRQQMLKVVNNQLKMNDPPETKTTFNRLKKLGYSSSDAKMLIGRCVAGEINEIMKSQRPFDEDRFVKALERLPEIDLDE